MMTAPTIGQLEKLSDEELRSRYDSATASTIVGLDFYLNELVRLR